MRRPARIAALVGASVGLAAAALAATASARRSF
jgi:hypothetical protein